MNVIPILRAIALSCAEHLNCFREAQQQGNPQSMHLDCKRRAHGTPQGYLVYDGDQTSAVEEARIEQRNLATSKRDRPESAADNALFRIAFSDGLKNTQAVGKDLAECQQGQPEPTLLVCPPENGARSVFRFSFMYLRRTALILV